MEPYNAWSVRPSSLISITFPNAECLLTYFLKGFRIGWHLTLSLPDTVSGDFSIAYQYCFLIFRHDVSGVNVAKLIRTIFIDTYRFKCQDTFLQSVFSHISRYQTNSPYSSFLVWVFIMAYSKVFPCHRWTYAVWALTHPPKLHNKPCAK